MKTVARAAVVKRSDSNSEMNSAVNSAPANIPGASVPSNSKTRRFVRSA